MAPSPPQMCIRDRFGGEKAKLIWTDVMITSQVITGAFSEFVKGISEVKLFGKSGEMTELLTDSIGQHLKWELKSYTRSAIPMSMYKSIVLSILSFVFPVGLILIKANPTSEMVLALLMALIISPSIYDPLMTCVSYGTQMGMLEVGLNEIDKIMDSKRIVSKGSKKKPEKWDLVFENVSFSYEDISDPLRKNALSDMSFIGRQGEMTALVGESGSGKSTIAQLLLRFWELEKGSIKIGDIDIKDLEIEELMDCVATVFQDTYIFADTIEANITMNREYPAKKIIEAAKEARCHEFIEKLPEGYKTKIGSGGVRLSGGEAQRVAIARAILKDSPIVVLDEALAYADAENENQIQTGIKNLLKNKTVIIIAHRLNTIREANNILVLKDGRLIEEGTHESLLNRGGEYKTLWDIQHKVDDWTIEK